MKAVLQNQTKLCMLPCSASNLLLWNSCCSFRPARLKEMPCHPLRSFFLCMKNLPVCWPDFMLEKHCHRPHFLFRSAQSFPWQNWFWFRYPEGLVALLKAQRPCKSFASSWVLFSQESSSAIVSFPVRSTDLLVFTFLNHSYALFYCCSTRFEELSRKIKLFFKFLACCCTGRIDSRRRVCCVWSVALASTGFQFLMSPIQRSG